MVKWARDRSDHFQIGQGVCQGDILSADLYKVYDNPLLKRLTDSGVGMTFGTVCCNTSACANDLTVCGKTESGAQVKASKSNASANLEHYKLQAVKSVALKVIHVTKADSIT